MQGDPAALPWTAVGPSVLFGAVLSNEELNAT